MSKPTSYPREKVRVLLLENISEVSVQQFRDAGYTQVERVSSAWSEGELLQRLREVHLLGIRSKTQLTEKVFQRAGKLLAVGCYCIGVNQVDLAAANRCGVAVFNAPFANTRSVAELVLGSAILLMRRVPEKDRAAHAGRWMKDAKGAHELRGKTLGIVGYGNIGSQLGILAEALGMQVCYTDPEAKLPYGNARPVQSLADLLARSHIVSLHVPSLPSTRNLIDAPAMSHMRKGAVLINYSRGDVVDIQALASLLRSGHLSGAAIDVFPDEPEKNGSTFHSPLCGLPNVLLTPHIGGSTEEAQSNIGLDVTSKLLHFLERGATTGSHSIPALSLPQQENTNRILHIHSNVPGVLSDINAALSSNGVNILGQYLKTNEQVGYVVLDVSPNLSASAVKLLRQVKGTIKTRLLY